MKHLIVDIHVQDCWVDGFIELAKNHQKESLKEPGCARFQVLRDVNNPNHFCLFETWFSESHLYGHRQTPHYAHWRTEVQKMESKVHYHTEWTGLGVTAA